MSDQSLDPSQSLTTGLEGTTSLAGLAGVNTMQGFDNLMALGSFDTSDLQAQVSRLAKQGIYVIDLGKLGFQEQPPADPALPMNYQLLIPATILDFKPLDPKAEGANDDLTGRAINERYFVYGKEIQEAIQLLMGKFKQAGFKHKGAVGGVEGAPPGWIDEANGKRVILRVSHYKPKDGEERAQFTWLSPKQMEKLGIPMNVLGRDFLDEFGRPFDPLAQAA